MKTNRTSTPILAGTWLLATLCGAVAQTSHDYKIASDPTGVFSAVSGNLPDGALLTSPAPPASSGDLRFAYWDINGVPALSSVGPSLSVASAAVNRDSFTMTAHYLPSGEDCDTDGIPDWREWRELHALSLDPSSDPDGDGLSVGNAMGRGFPLVIANTHAQGGVFRTSSATLSYHDPARRLAYHITSEPAGLVMVNGFVESGKIVTTANLWDVSQGRKLGYWTVNGVRVAAPNGSSPAMIHFAVTVEDTQVVAHYVDETADSDSDGMQDWQEYRSFGNLTSHLTSDPDGDGLTVLHDLTRGYPTNIPSLFVEGGVFRTSSANVTFHNPGAICSYTVTSEPAGYYSDAGQAAAGTVLTMPNFYGVIQGNRFACWLVDGKPFAGPDGACPGSIQFPLTHDAMKIVAKYVPESQDADVDGIPDWMEWWKFGSLSQDQSSDPDHDGFTIASELTRGNPLSIADRPVEGGLFRTSSSTIAYHDPARKFRYAVTSDPAGLNLEAVTVEPGTVYTSPNLFGAVQGYTFTHWTIDGVRQNGADGSARTQIIRSIDQDGIQFVAHYLPTSQDTDGDGISDWIEIRNFGDLFQSNDTNAAGDAFTNGVKLARGYPVTTSNLMVEGGVFRTSSASISYHDPSKLVVYQMTSDPVGLISQSAMVAAGTVLKTPNFYGDSQGYTFAGWTVNGVRQQGADGAAQTQISVTLDQDFIQIVAHYIPTGQDSDADGLPDWSEWFSFGTLANTGASDPNGDGWSIDAERTRGYSASVANSTVEGGVFRTSSATLTYHDTSIYKVYEFASEPSGLFYETKIVQPGTQVVTPNKYEDIQGYRFAYWSVNGVRQAGPSGVAQTRVAVAVNEDMKIVAHYLPNSLDGDADGIQDWWEWFYLGTSDKNRASVIDSDGLPLGTKIDRGYSPGVTAVMVEGGVFQTASKTVRWHNPNLFGTYVMRSEPEGLLNTEEGMVTPGATVMTPLLHGSTQGYTFAYWTVNGVYQASDIGGALVRLSVTIDATKEIVAHYLPDAADTDADGILDSYEWSKLGGLQYSRTDSFYRDSFTIGREQEMGFEPAIKNTMIEGGVFRTSSATISMNLAAYNFFHNLTIQVSPADSGTVSGAGSYRQGVVASLAPTPKPGFQFSHWGGDLDSSATPGRIAMDVPHTVTAVFIPADPYLTWQQLHFGTNPPDSLASDLADPDHDGLPNLLECALHGDPLAPGPLIHAATTPNGLSITFERDSSIPQITLDVEYTNSLTTDSWQPIARSENGTPTAALAPTIQAQETTSTTHPTIQSTTVTRPIQPNELKGFLRVKARR